MPNVSRAHRVGSSCIAALVAAKGAVAGLPSGVSTGDVTSTSAVVWTRTDAPGDVLIEVANDEAFTRVVFSTTLPAADALIPVKTLVDGLSAGTAYWVRATDAASAAAVGMFRTAQPAGQRRGLRFGASGDWRGELAPYPAVSNVPARSLDLFLKLGDTIYADYASPDLPIAQAETLEEFRIKHAEVYSARHGLNSWAEVHASTPILSSIDDHEVTNDFAGGAHPSSDPRFASFMGDFINDAPLFENGMQAFQEFNAIADEFYSGTGDDRMEGERRLYRARTFGRDAAIFLLDNRSFRDEPLPGVTDPFDQEQVDEFFEGSFDPSRTMLGRTQVDDLKSDLLAAHEAGVTWKFVCVAEPIQHLGVVLASDRFEGYAAERAEILSFIADHAVPNVVFIAADIHGTLVNSVWSQSAPGAPLTPVLNAFEITTGSVAFDAPFGPTVMAGAAAAGIITPQEYAIYLALPRPQQEQFVRALVDAQLLAFGYPLIGLGAADPVDATLLEGGYAATHTFGWTEFEIDASTRELTVTTWGIDAYTEADLNADPSSVTSRIPEVVGRFIVRPIGCLFDVDGDGDTDFADLNIVLGSFNTAAGEPQYDPRADLDGDLEVRFADLNLLLGEFNGDCATGR